MSSILRRGKKSKENKQKEAYDFRWLLGIGETPRSEPGPNGEIYEKEINIMSDIKKKSYLANGAIDILGQFGLKKGVDYDDLQKTEVVFAYLFHFGHAPFGTQSLFKVVTDKKVFYFQVESDEFYYLPRFTEETYDLMRATFIQEHTNLLDKYGSFENFKEENLLIMPSNYKLPFKKNVKKEKTRC